MSGFWDTTAIVPLLIHQPTTQALRRSLADDPGVVVWWGTTVEACSALARLTRDGLLTAQEIQRAVARLSVLRRVWREILPTEQSRALAEELPVTHAVTAGDALQLAAALLWCGRRPRGRAFVCLDRRLAAIAGRIGFSIPFSA